MGPVLGRRGEPTPAPEDKPQISPELIAVAVRFLHHCSDIWWYLVIVTPLAALDCCTDGNP